MSRIAVCRGDRVLAAHESAGETQLVYQGEYQAGDYVVLESEWEHAVVAIDGLCARVYLPEREMVYRLPFSGDNLAAYPPNAFMGRTHLITLSQDEQNEYRNLAQNALDVRGETMAYPHATANVETRDESVFCARNVLDGVCAARGHGEWPYVSWGIGAREDARITVDFGREVEIDKIVLYLRADFPHDAYWVSGTMTTDDGFTLTFPLKMYDGAQTVCFPLRKTRTLTLEKLIKCDMPSAFPALRQLKAYGRDV